MSQPSRRPTIKRSFSSGIGSPPPVGTNIPYFAADSSLCSQDMFFTRDGNPCWMRGDLEVLRTGRKLSEALLYFTEMSARSTRERDRMHKDSAPNVNNLTLGTSRFRAFGNELRQRFGGRIQRVSIDAGFTCPNVDGAVAKGGCNFCDNRSFSPSRRVRLAAVSEQLTKGITSVRRRYKNVRAPSRTFNRRLTPMLRSTNWKKFFA